MYIFTFCLTVLSTTVPIQASDPEVPVGKYFYLFVKFHLVNE